MFIDETEFTIIAGNGGPGVATFRREKYIPFGGPDGGDGGRGGDVILHVDSRMRTLADFRYQRRYAAEHGKPGRSRQMTGRSGPDLILRVPPGTIVRDAESGKIIRDLTGAEDVFVAAKGGDGGRGNTHFTTSSHRAPRECTPGWPGETRRVRLELKLLADVGLVGFPNAGKSTYINAVSRSRSPIGDYPFTTLIPHLGVVTLFEEVSFVIADIPGIIEGAHSGAGLGHQFLRHIERTSVIFHLVDVSPYSGRDPVEDYDILRRELALHDPGLAAKPELVLCAKIDVPGHEERLAALREHAMALGREVFEISGAVGTGTREPLLRAWQLLSKPAGDE